MIPVRHDQRLKAYKLGTEHRPAYGGTMCNELQPSAEIQNMMRKMILLCAALSLWAAGNTHAADKPTPIPLAAYQATHAPLAVRLASFQLPDASQRALAPHEPSTHSLLLVAIVLLSLRMRMRASSEKFST